MMVNFREVRILILGLAKNELHILYTPRAFASRHILDSDWIYPIFNTKILEIARYSCGFGVYAYLKPRIEQVSADSESDMNPCA